MGAVPEIHMKAGIVCIGSAQVIHLPKALLKKAKLGDDI